MEEALESLSAKILEPVGPVEIPKILAQNFHHSLSHKRVPFEEAVSYVQYPNADE
jgi:hypothetical protein